MAILSKTSRPMTKWQIIRRFQALLRRFRLEGKLTHGEAHVLAVLPEFMGDDGVISPSHEAMADISGASRRTIINALNRAYALGIVKHTPRGRASNTYEIIFPVLSEGGK
ncbi:helix-turn-helix domain-containing protein [Acetobacter cibinongensis]|uniref:helix-turn-helix domain-containing protein n=1 Tax=Acetobacter cibinongensis TaxID=146475 RepID=UPI001F0B1C3C|nr:helix-turn-helix domain-containing protein [Acetobacter cibinongensis]